MRTYVRAELRRYFAGCQRGSAQTVVCRAKCILDRPVLPAAFGLAANDAARTTEG
jgi:hypothetical protein